MVERARELIVNLLEAKKVDLVQLTYRREGGRMVLRLLVDKEGGITLDECSSLNEEIGRILDEENLINERYILEVSSPGLDRPLKTKRDFERVMGQRIRVHTYEPVGETRDHKGEVDSVDEENVTVSGIKIPLAKISKARLEIKT